VPLLDVPTGGASVTQTLQFSAVVNMRSAKADGQSVSYTFWHNVRMELVRMEVSMTAGVGDNRGHLARGPGG
jgi:hypothetical protein